MGELEEELAGLDRKEAAALAAKKAEAAQEADELDAFMKGLRSDADAGTSLRDIKLRKSQQRLALVQLKSEHARIERLAKIAKPVQLPSRHAAAGGKIWIGSMRRPGQRKELSVPQPKAEPDPAADAGEPEAEEGGSFTLEDLVKQSPDEPVSLPRPDKKPKQEKAEKRAEEPRQKAPPSEPRSQEADASEQEGGGGGGGGEEAAVEDESEEVKRRKRARVRGKKGKKGAGAEGGGLAAGYDAADPDYAVWLPPDNQSGDGRTALNDRFGY